MALPPGGCVATANDGLKPSGESNEPAASSCAGRLLDVSADAQVHLTWLS